MELIQIIVFYNKIYNIYGALIFSIALLIMRVYYPYYSTPKE